MKKLLYQNPLASPADIAGFRLEGRAEISFGAGAMEMKNSLDPSPGQNANFVLWCPEEFPSGIEINWQFSPVKEPGLCIMLVAELQADCRKANPIETFDTCVIKLRTAKGQALLFIASHAADRNIDPIFEITCEKAVITCDFSRENGLLAARLPDGQVKHYGALNTLEQEQKKIVNTIRWLGGAPGAEKPVSTVMTTQPFAGVIDYIFENTEFKPFDQEVIFDQAAKRYYVPGLSDALMDLYNNYECGRNP